MKRGGLSLPRPTAMNMPMPKGRRLLRAEDLDLQVVRPAEGHGLVGQDLRADVVGGALREVARPVGALADDPAALGGRRHGGRVRTGHDQGQVGQRRRRAVDVVAIDGRRVMHALDHAARHQLGERRPVQVGVLGQPVRQPDGDPRDVPTAEASLDGRAEAQRSQPVEVRRANRCHRPSAMAPPSRGSRRWSPHGPCRPAHRACGRRPTCHRGDGPARPGRGRTRRRLGGARRGGRPRHPMAGGP